MSSLPFLEVRRRGDETVVRFAGGRLVLADLRPAVSEVIAVTGLGSVLEVSRGGSLPA